METEISAGLRGASFVGPTAACIRSRDGMTLVEMMVASSLLVLVLCGFLTGFAFSRKAARAASDNMMALHTARQGIETLLDYDYDTLTNQFQLNTLYNLSSAGLSLGMSNCFIITQNPNYRSSYNILNVTVTVYWTNPARSNLNSLSFSSSISSCLH